MIELKKMYSDLMSQRDGKEKFENILGTLDTYLEDFHAQAPELYHKLKMAVYVDCYGYHFDESLLECAYEKMVNDDRTPAPHFSLEEVEKMARRKGIRFTDFNLYDLAYTVNMMYSDYCQVLGSDSDIYYQMAEKFLNDPDAPDGGGTKALRYFLSVHPKM